MLKKIFLVLVLIFVLVPGVQAFDQKKVEKIYVNFTNKLENTNFSDNKKLSILKTLDSKLVDILEKKDIKEIRYLYILNKSYTISFKKDTSTHQKEKDIQEEKIKFSQNTKTPYQNLVYYFDNYYDSSELYSLIGEDYYTYSYARFLYFEDEYGIYLGDLDRSGIKKESTLFIHDNGKYRFSNDYKKIKLIDRNTISDITNKNQFLWAIGDDNRFISNDYTEILKEIKAITEKIIHQKNTREDKIKAIYKWIVDNIVYYDNFTDGNKEIFSGVLTFKNGYGVCDGYTKLFLYMLSFAQIDDVEVIRGFAFNVVEYPHFGHAWVRIGDKYYDPTFDDPIGNKGILEENYSYFKLPKKLMYVDRYDGFYIKKEYNLSFEQRKTIARKNLFELYHKFENYVIMRKIRNYIKLGYNYNDTPTINNLKTKMDYFEVNNFRYVDNGIQKRIKTLKFYNIDDTILDIFLGNSQINISDFVLFKWDNDGYRLAYDIEFF